MVLILFVQNPRIHLALDFRVFFSSSDKRLPIFIKTITVTISYCIMIVNICFWEFSINKQNLYFHWKPSRILIFCFPEAKCTKQLLVGMDRSQSVCEIISTGTHVSTSQNCEICNCIQISQHLYIHNLYLIFNDLQSSF